MKRLGSFAPGQDKPTLSFHVSSLSLTCCTGKPGSSSSNRVAGEAAMLWVTPSCHLRPRKEEGWLGENQTRLQVVRFGF